MLRGLFHAAWFVQWTGQFDQRDPGPARPQEHRTDDAGQLHRPIARHDPDAAVAGYTGPRADLEKSLIKSAAEDHSPRRSWWPTS